MCLRGILLGLSVFLNSFVFAADFDYQSFITSSLEKAQPMQVKGVTISQHVQLFDLLSKRLQAESDKEKGISIARFLIAFSVNSYNEKLPHPENEQEKDVLTNALYSAVDYLRRQGSLFERDILAFIESRAKTLPGADQDHLAYLSSVLLASAKGRADSSSFMANKQTFIGSLTTAWLKEKLAQDFYWQYLDVYWANYIVAPALALGNSRLTSALMEPPLVRLAKDLSKTSDLRQAQGFATDLYNTLKAQANFSLLVSASSDQIAEAAQFVPALICLEKFRVFETCQAPLDQRDPSPLDYYAAEATDRSSQAVLLSLVTAIQKSLLNPKASAFKLVQLVRYQKNSRDLRLAKPAMEELFATGSIMLLINDDLISQIQRTSLTIFGKQKEAIEREAKKQRLITYDSPTYDQQAGKKYVNRLSFYHFDSSGSDLQCGFFSLGWESRQQAISQLTDNLVENNIYFHCDRISCASAVLKKIMGDYIREGTPIPREYLDLYAKNHGLDCRDGKLQDHLIEAYTKLAKQISEAEAAIDDEFEALKRERGLPDKVPEEGDDAPIANAVSALRQGFENRKWVEHAKVSQLFYSLPDFQELIEKDINKKFAGGLFKISAQVDWKFYFLTYPQVLAFLNDYDIYSWVSTSVFESLKRETKSSVIKPLHENDAFVLIDFISGREDARRIDIVNRCGNHFQKWVLTNDYAALAKAIRHKKAYSLPDTR